jgi:hypothetical protein
VVGYYCRTEIFQVVDGDVVRSGLVVCLAVFDGVLYFGRSDYCAVHEKFPDFHVYLSVDLGGFVFR